MHPWKPTDPERHLENWLSAPSTFIIFFGHGAHFQHKPCPGERSIDPPVPLNDLPTHDDEKVAIHVAAAPAPLRAELMAVAKVSTALPVVEVRPEDKTVTAFFVVDVEAKDKTVAHSPARSQCCRSYCDAGCRPL
jgi:hypothetical protein